MEVHQNPMHCRKGPRGFIKVLRIPVKVHGISSKSHAALAKIDGTTLKPRGFPPESMVFQLNPMKFREDAWEIRGNPMHFRENPRDFIKIPWPGSPRAANCSEHKHFKCILLYILRIVFKGFHPWNLSKIHGGSLKPHAFRGNSWKSIKIPCIFVKDHEISSKFHELSRKLTGFHQNPMQY